MTLIRYSLLGEDRDADYYKRWVLTGALCLLASVLLHLLFFTAWQLLDKDATDNFHFVLMGDQTPIELALTFGEVVDGAESIDLEQPGASAPASAPGGLFSPADEWAESGLSADVLEALDRLMAEGGDDYYTEGQVTTNVQAAAPPSLVDEDLARAELLPDAAEDGAEEVNPEPPISLEHQAPPFKSYFTQLSSAINRRWILPPEAQNQFKPGRLSVLFTIRRDGQLLRLVVQESSGNATLDHAGLEALRSAAPFPPFPPELSHREQLDIIMNFNYKATYKRHSRPGS